MDEDAIMQPAEEARGRSPADSAHSHARAHSARFDRSVSAGRPYGDNNAIGTDNASSEHGGDSTAAAQVTTADTAAKLKPARIPTLLLLAMFAIAARYSPSAHNKSVAEQLQQQQNAVQRERSERPDSSMSSLGGETSSTSILSSDPDVDADTALPLPPSGHMWAAGDGFLERARGILDRLYATSRPSTVQALLLMGYREIGIGAMAQSWLYVGMAVRMAQDLGLHRQSDRWERVDGPIFTPLEQQLRRRIWYACVVMDKYVSTYIGRPLSIFENDYDTALPELDHVRISFFFRFPSLIYFSCFPSERGDGFMGVATISAESRHARTT